jgi:hypothetical protein
MESEREQKQNFLRENILEKNYDPETFLKYLSDIKGDDAGDVDVWTFDELKKVVCDFIQQHSEGETNNDIHRENSNNMMYGSDDEKCSKRSKESGG